MIRNLNFRRPLNICFLKTAIIFTLACIAVLAVQWHDVKSSYQRQNMRDVQNLAAYTAKYLHDYDIMLDETIEQFISIKQDKKNDDGELRHWLFERFSTMPDARTLVYADQQGGFIRLPNVELNDKTEEDTDPRHKIWYMAAIRDDGGNTHYTRSRDIFDDAVSTLTLSKSLINNVDGEKLGVLAIRLNQEPSMDILNAAYSTLPGRKWIMDNEGQQITNEREAVNPQTLVNVAPRLNKQTPYFYLPDSDKWYFCSAVGDTTWFLVHEVRNNDLISQVFTHSLNVIYCLAFGLLALFVCWWMVRSSLNGLYISIANGIRNGAIELKAAEEMLYEEIHNTTVQQEMIKNEALTDGLTELKNRRAFDNDIEFLQQASDLCIAMIDIDNFKTINDTYGHAVGDMVLRTVSDIGLRLRGMDNITLYRYGGEEIAVLFHGMTQHDALAFLERWRETCEQRHFRETNLRVTFSGGIATKDDMRVEEALVLADKRLYEAKRNGKNRIIDGAEAYA